MKKEPTKYTEKNRYQRLSVLQKWIFQNWDEKPEKITRKGLQQRLIDLQELHSTRWLYLHFFGLPSEDTVPNSLVHTVTNSLKKLERRGLLTLRFRDTSGCLTFSLTSKGLLVTDYLNFVNDSNTLNRDNNSNITNNAHNSNIGKVSEMRMLFGFDPELIKVPEEGIEGEFLGEIRNPTTYFYLCLIKTHGSRVVAIKGSQPLKDVIIGDPIRLTRPRISPEDSELE